MKSRSVFLNLQCLITQDQKYVFTVLSYVTIFLIFVNISLVNSPIVGLGASAIYFLINATYLGHAMFEQENAFVEFMLGLLLLTVVLGLVAWAILILHNLNNIASVIVLSITSSFASFLNRKEKTRNAVR